MLMVPEAEKQAIRIGCTLTHDIFSAWRRNLDAIDALILLAITRSNVDGVLYNRELRRRYGGADPIAPNDLRQPVSIAVLALNLGLSERLVSRRIGALAARGECQSTRTGMLITDDQVTATDRLRVVQDVYEALRVSCERLDQLEILALDHLPAPTHAKATPLRSASAHGAKYVLRLLSTLGRSVGGDAIDGLIMAELIAADRPINVELICATVGLKPRLVHQRLRSLYSAGICILQTHSETACDRTKYWFADSADRNMGHLYQLLAGLAEVGALRDFGRAFRQA